MGTALGQVSPQFNVPAWWPEPPDIRYAEGCAAEIALAHAPLLEEIRGYADGQQQSYEDFLRIICRQKLNGRVPRVPETGGCTSFAWQAPNGHILVGRNYDFHPVQRVRQRIHAVPTDGYPTVGMRGSVPVGRYDGVNSAGLFVSLHVVPASSPAEFRVGVPFHLIPRLLLETCATVREAIDALMLLPHLHSFNYLLADATEFAVVEAHHDRVRIVRPENNLLAVGNFYQHPQMETLQGRRMQKVSRARVEFLQDCVPALHADPWEALKIAMRDQTVPVCGLEGGHTTLWSCLVDLTARRLAYAMGSPLHTEYEFVAWATSHLNISSLH